MKEEHPHLTVNPIHGILLDTVVSAIVDKKFRKSESFTSNALGQVNALEQSLVRDDLEVEEVEEVEQALALLRRKGYNV